MRWLVLLLMLAGPACAADVTVAPYTAVCDGVTDDTAAIQAAFDGTDNELYLPRKCAIAAELHVTRSLTLTCANPQTAGLKLTSPTQNGIVVTTADPVQISRCLFTGAQTSGAMVTWDAPPGSNSSLNSLDNVQMVNAYIGLRILRASWFHVNRSAFFSYTGYAIHSYNAENPDAGDGEISGNTFLPTPGTGLACIFVQNGGGLRIYNNKCLYGQSGIQVGATGLFSDLLIEGNSIEGQSGASINLAPADPSAALITVSIVGNEIGPGNTGILVSPPTNGTPWVRTLTIASNNCVLVTPASECIDVYGTKGLAIGTNGMRDLTTATSYGVVVRPGSSVGVIEHQACDGIDTCVLNQGTSITKE